MPDTLHLRPYTPDDLAACLQIWRDASEAGHPFLSAADLDADAAMVRDIYIPAAEMTLACDGARVVGFVALLGQFIGGLFVDPVHHRRGIGRRLLQAAAERHGPLTVEVYAANTRAMAFYENLGFHETSRRATDDQSRPLPVIWMEQPGATPQSA
ncbi:GNAT family N-acetyltransferase [Pararhodobacter sp.]|jgi:GNAT superfamily N-acetyltransferase|uniref:GNAT family N-acetyltransferase n=1 Tax=Pararhodobacter sp. TaxID=2127056 RepID=UPI002FDD081B